MHNIKLNKGIVTGLATITLFAPIVLHNTQINASTRSDTTTTTINDDPRISGITLDGSIDSTSNPSRQDFNDDDIGHIAQINLSNGNILRNNYNHNQGSQVTSDINGQYQTTNSTTSNYNIINTPSASTNNNSNDNNQQPQTNNSSKSFSFPNAPTNHQEINYKKKQAKHYNKTNTKSIEKDKIVVKKNQKDLKKIKRELKETKIKSRKAKLNEQLKKAKKAFAKSEVQLNHAKHVAK